jgi:hypothetical protein
MSLSAARILVCVSAFDLLDAGQGERVTTTPSPGRCLDLSRSPSGDYRLCSSLRSRVPAITHRLNGETV